MLLEDKIFTVIDDIPSLNAVGINIPSFKKLYLKDKSPTKEMYRKHLYYIYHMGSILSPYYDIENKEQEVRDAAYGQNNSKKVITNDVLEALEDFKKLTNFTEKRTLDALLTQCNVLINDLTETNTANRKQLNELISEIDKTISQLSIDDIAVKLSLREQKDKLLDSHNSAMEKSVKIMPSLTKNIELILELKEKVLKTTYKGDYEKPIVSLFDDISAEYINSKLYEGE